MMPAKRDVPRAALITGGAYGIGRATVRLFAARGWRVCFADIDAARGAVLESEMRASGASCTFVHTDVRDAAALEGLVAAAASEGAGRLDALVNNAGIEKYAEPSQFTPEDWDSILGTNLRSAFLCSRLAEPHLARTGGSIVNVSSVHAFANERGAAIYAASKTGLLGLTRTLALDFAPRVRVNAVCPGAIQTGLMEKYLASQEDPAAVAEEMGARIPLARVGAPEDVAGVIWFLASPEAAYMTGSTIVVDGGLLARLAI